MDKQDAFGKKESYDHRDMQKFNSTAYLNDFDEISPMNKMKDSKTTRDLNSKFAAFAKASKTNRTSGK